MDINIVKGLLTLILMIAFVSMIVWIFQKKHKHYYDQVAKQALELEAEPENEANLQTNAKEPKQ